MSFEDLPEVDAREREPKDGEYRIKSFGSGYIVCTTPGLQLVDFYRNTSVPSKDVTLVPSGAGVVVGEIPHATPQNMNGGQV